VPSQQRQPGAGAVERVYPWPRDAGRLAWLTPPVVIHSTPAPRCTLICMTLFILHPCRRITTRYRKYAACFSGADVAADVQRDVQFQRVVARKRQDIVPRGDSTGRPLVVDPYTIRPGVSVWREPVAGALRR
jgi:hypothetical protein